LITITGKGTLPVIVIKAARREIGRGLADSEANRTTPVENVAKEFGLKA